MSARVWPALLTPTSDSFGPATPKNEATPFAPSAALSVLATDDCE